MELFLLLIDDCWILLIFSRSMIVDVKKGAAGGGSSIYPDNHWSLTKKLTADSFETEVQSAIDAGKTMFVRFIASEG